MTDDTFLNAEQFLRVIVNGWVVDGRSGGLVHGRSHAEGGILMITPSSPLGHYKILGTLEGGEYLMSVGATETYFDRLITLNESVKTSRRHMSVETTGRRLDVAATPHDKFLIVMSQIVINREATATHIRELEELNGPHAFFTGRVLPDEYIEEMRAPYV